MKAYGWFGLALLLVSEFCLFLKIEPFYSWFYCFAWWSYILLADNLLFSIRGDSLFTTRRRELATMLPLSVFIWLLFEAYNLIIRNWAYDGLPPQVWIRWPGYFVSFATVLPGLFITSDLIQALIYRGSKESVMSASEQNNRKVSQPSTGFMVLALFLTAAPLFWPRYFFPAVWLGPLFLFDPLLERFGIQSLSLSISAGDRRRVWSLLLGGLTCGLMWEFWNFWAASKWVYTVPFFAEWKVFEMPLLGFLGFPPFALECWVLYHLILACQRRWASGPARVAQWLAIGLISVAVFSGIDRRTVQRFSEETRTDKGDTIYGRPYHTVLRSSLVLGPNLFDLSRSFRNKKHLAHRTGAQGVQVLPRRQSPVSGRCSWKPQDFRVEQGFRPS